MMYLLAIYLDVLYNQIRDILSDKDICPDISLFVEIGGHRGHATMGHSGRYTQYQASANLRHMLQQSFNEASY